MKARPLRNFTLTLTGIHNAVTPSDAVIRRLLDHSIDMSLKDHKVDNSTLSTLRIHQCFKHPLESRYSGLRPRAAQIPCASRAVTIEASSTVRFRAARAQVLASRSTDIETFVKKAQF